MYAPTAMVMARARATKNPVASLAPNSGHDEQTPVSLLKKVFFLRQT